MNRNEAKKLAPIIKAFGDGKDVQYHSMGRYWITVNEEYNPLFDSTVEWRVKPEEVLDHAEWLKSRHSQPAQSPAATYKGES